ncbi:uncharacterized protein LOC144198755 [Stigmatopora nigra]
MMETTPELTLLVRERSRIKRVFSSVVVNGGGGVYPQLQSCKCNSLKSPQSTRRQAPTLSRHRQAALGGEAQKTRHSAETCAKHFSACRLKIGLDICCRQWQLDITIQCQLSKLKWQYQLELNLN